jgi:hypothetical protein
VVAPENVSAVVPTRGDLDMSTIVESLEQAGFGEIIVYDNSKRPDLGIYARYAAALEASNPVVVTQDDDVLMHDWPGLLAGYRPGRLTVNYPEPWDVPWVACGSVFDRELPAVAFGRWEAAGHDLIDRVFTHFVCDAVFALLTDDVKVIDVGYEDLPVGYAAGRVSTSNGWYTEKRPAVVAECARIRAAL